LQLLWRVDERFAPAMPCLWPAAQAAARSARERVHLWTLHGLLSASMTSTSVTVSLTFSASRADANDAASEAFDTLTNNCTSLSATSGDPAVPSLFDRLCASAPSPVSSDAKVLASVYKCAVVGDPTPIPTWDVNGATLCWDCSART
jgi:hypothetical protein